MPRSKRKQAQGDAEQEDQPVFDEQPLEGELITGPREYELKKPLVVGRTKQYPGTMVKLNDHQAERLKRSGHI